jgi:hypothetical protein
VSGCDRANEITCDDLFAVSLLDGSWEPRAVRRLLYEQAATVTGFLARIGPDTALWEAATKKLGQPTS